MIHLPHTIRRMIDEGALFVLNDSGGKDSQAMRLALRTIVPHKQKVVIHATLSDVEWPGALEHARLNAQHDGLPFHVTEATKTFFDMVERNYANKPEAPCWPSAKYRQCTSDLKRGPIEREIRKILKQRFLNKVVNCVGIRAEESSKRAKLPTLKYSNRNSKAGREWWDWLPIHDLKRTEVVDMIHDAGEKMHYAYGTGNDRLSCMFCIMGSKGDLQHAARENPALYDRYVQLEIKTGYTMHESRKPLEEITGIPAPCRAQRTINL